MLEQFKKAHQEFEKLSGGVNPIIKTLQRIYKNTPPVFVILSALANISNTFQ